MGYSGLNTALLPQDQAYRVMQFDACKCVGAKHGVEHYIASPTMMKAMRIGLFHPDVNMP